MLNFLKGIIIGIGGIAPGLSGSVLLVILGLYEKVINSIGTLFKDFKKNISFLAPLFMGFGVGVIIFSKIVNYLLNNFEVYTRFAFLGLVTGTIPLFYKEVKKHGFNKKYYKYIIGSAIVSLLFFNINKNIFPVVENPNIIQSTFLGVAVAGSSIIPGVDSAVILSTLGLYELYVSSIANFNFSVLFPAGIGLILGAIIISTIINKLIKKYYTATFSIIFGMFLAIIPNVLTSNCRIELNFNAIISIGLVIFGFIFSYILGSSNKEKGNIKNKINIIKKLLKRLYKSNKQKEEIK